MHVAPPVWGCDPVLSLLLDMQVPTRINYTHFSLFDSLPDSLTFFKLMGIILSGSGLKVIIRVGI